MEVNYDAVFMDNIKKLKNLGLDYNKDESVELILKKLRGICKLYVGIKKNNNEKKIQKLEKLGLCCKDYTVLNKLHKICKSFNEIKKKENSTKKNLSMFYKKEDILHLIPLPTVLIDIIWTYHFSLKFLCKKFAPYDDVIDNLYIKCYDQNKIRFNSISEEKYQAIDERMEARYDYSVTVFESDIYYYCENDDPFRARNKEPKLLSFFCYYNFITKESSVVELKNQTLLQYFKCPEEDEKNEIWSIEVNKEKLYIVCDLKNRIGVFIIDLKTNMFEKKFMIECDDGYFQIYIHDDIFYTLFRRDFKKKCLEVNTYNILDEKKDNYNLDFKIKFIKEYIDDDTFYDYDIDVSMCIKNKHLFLIVIYKIYYREDEIKYYIALYGFDKMKFTSCHKIENFDLKYLSDITRLNYVESLNRILLKLGGGNSYMLVPHFV